MEKLLKHGYIVYNRICINGKICYLLSQTKRGDWFLIKVDLPELAEIEIQLEDDLNLNPDIFTNLPQASCYKCSLNGSAFVCNELMCITTPKSEQTFILEKSRMLTKLTNFNNYPIMLLSAILSNPKQVENLIFETNKNLEKTTFELLHKEQANLQKSVQELDTKVKALGNYISFLEKNIQGDINKVEDAYDKFKDVDLEKLTPEGKELYNTIVTSLTEKKDILNQGIEKIAEAQTLSKSIQNITEEIDTIVDPSLEQAIKSSGKVLSEN